MQKLIFLITIAAVSFSSCRVIPYYTTVDKMVGINPGMKLDAVSATLGVNPHGYYLDVNNGKKIVVYKYKHRYHKVLKIEVPTEHGLAGGSPRFRKPSNAYFVFDQYSGKLEGYITDLGRKSGEDLLMEESYLRLFLNNPGKMRKLKSGSAKSKSGLRSSLKKKAGKVKRSKSQSSSKDKLKANRTPKGASAKSKKKDASSRSSAKLQNSEKVSTISFGSGLSFFITPSSWDNYETTKMPVINSMYDISLNNVVSLGVGLSYQRASGTYDYTYSYEDPWTGFEDITEEVTVSRSKLNLRLRTNFHYGRKEKLDMYSGFGLGLSLDRFNHTSSDPYYLEDASPNYPITLQIIPIGMQYYLTEKSGVHVELGLIGPYVVAFGLTFKL